MRRVNAKSGSARRVHCTPVRPDGGWIDRGRWRRGHRLALLGVMTLTQCSAMASANGTFPGKSRGVVVVDVGASTSSTLCDRLVSNAATRQGRGKNAVIGAAGGGTSTLSTPYTATDVDESPAQDRWDLKLGGRERGRSIIELNLRSDRDRDTFLLAFARECPDETVVFRLEDFN